MTTNRKIKIRLIIDREIDISYYSNKNGDTLSALKKTKKIIKALKNDSFRKYGNEFVNVIKIFESFGASLCEKDYNYLKKYYKPQITNHLSFKPYNLDTGLIAIRELHNANYEGTSHQDSNATIYFDDNNFKFELDVFPYANPNSTEMKEANVEFYSTLVGYFDSCCYATNEYKFNEIYDVVFNEKRKWHFFTTEEWDGRGANYYIDDGVTSYEELIRTHENYVEDYEELDEKENIAD